jgi:hypothetical protein
MVFKNDGGVLASKLAKTLLVITKYKLLYLKVDICVQKWFFLYCEIRNINSLFGYFARMIAFFKISKALNQIISLKIISFSNKKNRFCSLLCKINMPILNSLCQIGKE